MTVNKNTFFDTNRTMIASNVARARRNPPIMKSVRETPDIATVIIESTDVAMDTSIMVTSMEVITTVDNIT